MRPTFLGFETGRRAIMAAQKGIDLTGHNVSNAGTKGYTRQRIDQYSIYPHAAGYRYSTGITSTAGHGVGMIGVAQMRDPFLDNHFRMEYQEYSRLDTVTSGLSGIESIFDEVTSKHFTDNLDEMFTQLQKLSTDADRPEYANILMTKSKEIAFIFNTYAKDLAKHQEKQKFELDASVDKVNDILKKLAAINKDIRDEYITINHGLGGGALGPRVNEKYGPNELLDDRNVLLDELSSLVNIDVVPDTDGTVNVYMGVGNDRIPLLDKFKTVEFEIVTKDGDGNVNNTLSEKSTFEINIHEFDKNGNKIKDPSWTNVTAKPGQALTAGSIKGYMDILTGKGGYANPDPDGDPDTNDGENGDFQGLPYYREIINSFANTFAKAFNEANSYSESKNANGTGATNIGGADVTFRAPLGNDNLKVNVGTIPGGQGTARAEWTAQGELTIYLEFGQSYTQEDIQKLIDNASVPTDAAGNPDPNFEKVPVNVYVKNNADGTKGAVKDPMITHVTFEKVERPLFVFTDVNNNPVDEIAANIKVNPDWIKDPLGWLNTTKDIGAGDSANNNILAMIDLFDKKLDYLRPELDSVEFNGTFKEYIKYYTGKLGQDVSFYGGLTENRGAVASAVEDKRFSISSVDLNDEGINMMDYQKAFNAASRFVTTLDQALDTIINNMGIVGR